MSLTTYNDKLLCSPYAGKGQGIQTVDTGIAGWSGVKQKNTLIPLEVLADAKLRDGTIIKKGSKAFFEEEILTSKDWSTKEYFLDGTENKGIVVDWVHVFGVEPKKTTRRSTSSGAS